MAKSKRAASRFRSSVGSGERGRPVLATTVAVETDAALRAYSERTGVAIGQVIDRAVAAYLGDEMRTGEAHP